MRKKIKIRKNLTEDLALGILWDMKENEGKGKEPGTFAELPQQGLQEP